MQMAISNSFHCSAKKHSIKNKAALGKVQGHNSRSYNSITQSKDNIYDLHGTAATLSADVIDFINEQFKDTVDSYNENQKRNDRKIKTDPFEYFESNKQMDVATEAIFQIGDKGFWSNYRTDTKLGTNKKGKPIVKHEFSDQVKTSTSNIFSKQAEAVENIYITEKKVIRNKIQTAFDTADKYLWNFQNEHSLELKMQFEDIFVTKKKEEQKAKFNALNDEHKALYKEFEQYKQDWSIIKDSRLLERIDENQMHIKLVNLTAHFDENSPHAHGVMVCWADGFKKGLSSRLAKSIVMNKWTLEVIQDKLHQIALEQMKDNDIFKDVDLKDKEKGRDYHYDVEEYIDKQLHEKQQKIDEQQSIIGNLEKEIEVLKTEKTTLQKELIEQKSLLDDLKRSYRAVLEKAKKIVDAIQPLERLQAVLNIIWDFPRHFMELADKLANEYKLNDEQLDDLEEFYQTAKDANYTLDEVIDLAKDIAENNDEFEETIIKIDDLER